MMKNALITFLACWVLFASQVFANEVLYHGKWRTIDFDVAGMWQIVREDDGVYVVLDDQFETKNGPDLHILLTTKPVDSLTDANTGQGSLVVGLLKTTDTSSFFQKMKGAQKLKIPDGVSLEKYTSIAIHCVRYSHVWAGANLK